MDTWTCCAWRAVAVRHAVDVVVSRGEAWVGGPDAATDGLA